MKEHLSGHFHSQDYSNWIIEVNENDFPERVVQASWQIPILVDFWADWCGPCRAFTPLLERVIRGYQGAIILAKVEADENMRLAGHYRLRGFPTCLLFWHGEMISHFSGMRPEHFLHEFLETHAQLPHRAHHPHFH